MGECDARRSDRGRRDRLRGQIKETLIPCRVAQRQDARQRLIGLELKAGLQPQNQPVLISLQRLRGVLVDAAPRRGKEPGILHRRRREVLAGYREPPVRREMRDERARPRMACIGRGEQRSGGSGRRRAWRQGELEMPRLGNADLLADQPIRLSLEAERAITDRRNGHRQHDVTGVGIAHYRPLGDAHRRRPLDVSGPGSAGEGPGDVRRCAGIARVLPIDVPAWSDAEMQPQTKILALPIAGGLGDEGDNCPLAGRRRTLHRAGDQRDKDQGRRDQAGMAQCATQ